MAGLPTNAAKPGRRWGLVMFWAVILSGAAAGCGYLQYLGPPPPGFYDTPVPIKVGAQAAASPPAAAQQAAPQARQQAGQPLAPALAAASVTASPKLLAAGVQAATSIPPPANVARVAVVIAGLGDDLALSQMAANLPPAFAMALSPYGKSVTQAAAAARYNGHETLLLLPMPGLLAGASPHQNAATLQWAMAQFQGYAGVTDAFGPAMGGGFMAYQPAKTWLMANIARHGLFYIEGDPGATALLYAAGRKADLIIDAAYGAAAETKGLAALVTDGQSRHAALAVLLNPTPAALQILRGWSATLATRGAVLVPVSALVRPPDVALPLYASSKQ